MWPGVFPSDVRQSDLVDKHIKRGIIISIHSIQFKFNSIQLNSIQIDSRFIASYHSCRRCVMIEIYLFLESDVLWELHNSTTTEQH